MPTFACLILAVSTIWALILIFYGYFLSQYFKFFEGIIILIFVCCMYSGFRQLGREDMQDEAFKRGYGNWKADKVNNTEWMWKDAK